MRIFKSHRILSLVNYLLDSPQLFAPYFKDHITIFLFIVLLSALVFFMPYVLENSVNYEMGNLMLITKAPFNIRSLKYKVTGLRFFASSNISRTCNASDGKNLDNTESILNNYSTKSGVSFYYDKKYTNADNDPEMEKKLEDQEERVLFTMNLRSLETDPGDPVSQSTPSKVGKWLEGVDSVNLGDPNKSDNSEDSSPATQPSAVDANPATQAIAVTASGSSNINESSKRSLEDSNEEELSPKRFRQDSSDVLATDFNSWEPFDE